MAKMGRVHVSMPDDIQAGPGWLWVADADRTLYRLNPVTGETVHRWVFSPGGHTTLAIGDDAAWIAARRPPVRVCLAPFGRRP